MRKFTLLKLKAFLLLAAHKFDDKKWLASNMHKCSIWKLDTNNEALPHGVPPIEEHQKETQYPEQYKNATGKGLWSGKCNEGP